MIDLVVNAPLAAAIALAGVLAYLITAEVETVEAVASDD